VGRYLAALGNATHTSGLKRAYFGIPAHG